MRSRPAPDVLRAIKQWFVDLKRLPGGGEEASGVWQMTADDRKEFYKRIPEHLVVRERDDMKYLYRKHGWPNNFDGAAFNADRARLEARCNAVSDFNDIREKVQRQQSTMEWINRDLLKHRNEMQAAESDDTRLAAEWELRKLEIIRDRSLRTHQEERLELERVFPSGRNLLEDELYLGESENLERTLDWLERSLKNSKKREPGLGKKESNNLYLLEAQHVRVRRALDECRADLGQRGLTPRTWVPENVNFTRSQQWRREIRTHELPSKQQFLDQLPVNATATRQAVQADIDRTQKGLEDSLEKDKTIIRLHADKGEPIKGYETVECLKD
ncbi:hypothetical protein JX265_005777 [Neoarthrinium moseri]|uniref:Uncharacterized protein n=1 Tax=Neoarthrinium moseri TaxID=1658444 RepID=A0A9P9WN73_9PEZI|nr:hypothetical protein JX266_012516 [Neoarthrinium moseri]KAI1871791.1 hypothetical protein JX265_005777 [Neoarthrinium moseri]